MDKDSQMFNTATTVPEWPQYAKMLFSSSNHIQQQNNSSLEQQIVCSPSPNTTFRKTHVPNITEEKQNKSIEGGNAFLDFINNQKKQLEKVKHVQKHYLTPVFNGKTNQNDQSKQQYSLNPNSLEDSDDGELQIVSCTKLLKNIYNQLYIETQISQHIKIIQNRSNQVNVYVKTFFDVPKPIDKFVNSFSISPRQNTLQRFMVYFDKTKGIVYCSNLEMTEISEYTILQPLSFSKSVCVDSISKRFFLYNNRNNEICIYSLTEDRLLCRLQSYVPRLNPQLYFHESKQILLVLGGYHNQNKQKISSKIQIYKFNQRNIDLQPTIINLNISRFNPLISQFNVSNKDYLLVVGGISKVSLLQNSVFFNENQQMNKMTNSNGEIIDLDQYSIQTVSVQNSRSLHLNSGHNIILKNKLITFLLNSQCIIQLTMQNNSNSHVIKIQEQSDCLSNTFIKYFGKTKFNLQPQSQSISKSQPRIINNESLKMSASDINLNTINTIQNINHIVGNGKGQQECEKLKIKKDLQNKYCCPLI